LPQDQAAKGSSPSWTARPSRSRIACIPARGGAFELQEAGYLTLQAASGARFIFNNNSGTYGGVVVSKGYLTINNADFSGNTASSYNGGAIYNSSGTLTIDNSTFSANTAKSEGGAIFNLSGTATVSNTTFSDNYNQWASGGALVNQGVSGTGSNLIMTDSSFTGNRGYYSGGAMTNESGSTADLTRVTFTDNTAADNGGAIYNNNSMLTVRNGTFTRNKTTGTQTGGAIHNNSTLIIENSTFDGNQSGSHGGAIYSYNNVAGGAAVTISNSTFSNNSTRSNRGGAIYNQNNPISLTNVDFLNNTASWNGGGIFTWNGDLNLAVETNRTNTFSGNTDGDGANSIFVSSTSAGNTVTVDLDVGTGALLDMKDPFAGENGGGNIAVVKRGAGAWSLGGANILRQGLGGSDSNTNTVDIQNGDLNLYRNAQIHAQGPGSAIAIGSAGTPVNVTITGGNQITVSNDTTNALAATGQGSITIQGNSTWSFDLAGASTDTAMMELKADAITIVNGQINIDLKTLAKSSGDIVLLHKTAATSTKFDNTTINDGSISIRGHQIASTRATGGYQVVIRDDDTVVLRLPNALQSHIVTWRNYLDPASPTWDMISEQWVNESGVTDVQFLVGDVVNFNSTEAPPTPAVVVDPNGVEASGLFVSWNYSYDFSGGSIVTSVDGWLGNNALPAIPEVVTGKLMLGAQADNDGMIGNNTFKGILDVTGINTDGNDFRQGIDIYSGRLRVSATEQINPGLSKLSFLGSSADFSTVRTSLLTRAGSLAADIYNARQTDPHAYLPTVIAADNLVFDGFNSDSQRLVLATNAAGGFSAEAGKTVTWQNSMTSADGGAIAAGLQSMTLLTAADATAGYRFTGNVAGGNGGAVSNQGALYAQNTAFEQNQATGSGGAIWNNDLTFLSGSSFTGNYAQQNGGAIYSGSGNLSLTDFFFTRNQAGASGGAIMAAGQVYLGLGTGVTGTFSGNLDSAGSNSINLFTNGANTTLDLAVQTGAILDMLDPMRGLASGNAIAINKTGDGAWKLGGDNTFSGGSTTVSVLGGTLQLYNGGTATNVNSRDALATVSTGNLFLNGAGSRFILGGGGSAATLEVGGFNTITANGGTAFQDQATILAGQGNAGLGKLTFTSGTLDDNVTFSADAARTLTLDGQLSGTGNFIKTGDGEINMARTGNTVGDFDIRAGTIGLFAGTDVNVTANSARFLSGTTLNLYGFDTPDYGKFYTVIRDADCDCAQFGVGWREIRRGLSHRPCPVEFGQPRSTGRHRPHLV